MDKAREMLKVTELPVSEREQDIYNATVPFFC